VQGREQRRLVGLLLQAEAAFDLLGQAAGFRRSLLRADAGIRDIP
jgi:hypothetical protein